MPQAGEVVWVRFPYSEADADKSHPALVLDVLEDSRCLLAYGTSKQVDASCPRASEVVVATKDDLAACGLHVPTRFDISRRVTMAIDEKKIAGALPQRLYKQLYRAVVHCRLI